MVTYGFKVSKEGFDVDTAGDGDLVMSSDYNMLKSKMTGALTGVATVAHGLGYLPIFFAMHKQVGNFTRYSACWGGIVGDVGVDGTNLAVNTASQTIRYYIMYQQGA